MDGRVTDDDPFLTIDDVIRGGACVDGAYATLTRIAKQAPVPAAMRASEIRKLLRKDERKHLDQATQSDGYGDGNGYGYGYGYGYGDGSGYGDGYGSGYGSGSGSGSGSGDGDGDGYGSGSGDGSGSGSG